MSDLVSSYLVDGFLQQGSNAGRTLEVPLRSLRNLRYVMAVSPAALSTEFRQFLGQARGSLMEMETQIVIAGNLAYLTPQAVAGLMNRSGEVSRLLHGLIRSPATSRNQGPDQRLLSSFGSLETRN